MTMIGTTERDRIAEEIRKTRADQARLPIHWTDQRELLAQRLETLVNEWLDAGPGTLLEDQAQGTPA